MKNKEFNIMKKRFLAALLCLCLLVGLVPGMGTTAFAASDHNIGDIVTFAGYDWYIMAPKARASPPRRAATPCLRKTMTSALPRSGREPIRRTVRRITTRTATCKKRWRKSQTDFPPRTGLTSPPVTRWTALRANHPPASFCGPSAKRNGTA